MWRQFHLLTKTMLVLASVFLIAIMVAGTVPHHCPSRQARESAFTSSLRHLRDAIQNFKNDTGRFPVDLNELCCEKITDLKGFIPEGGVFRGPYLPKECGVNGTGIPANHLLDDCTNRPIEDQWLYDSSTGIVKSAFQGISLEGKSYTDY